MAKRTLAETIRQISQKHLDENNGLLIGQCISAVGWVNGTVPQCKGIVELPMTESCGAGIAVGAAMVGRRPIFVVRFQDFMMLNGSPFVNYAAKCLELHGRGAPVFIRALASEGIGPVHSGVLHSIFMHFPGFRVSSPMTSGEYVKTWEEFMAHDDPMFVSEHRVSFAGTEEMPDVIHERANITLFGISAPRFELARAAEMLKQRGITCNVVHVFRLKPFEVEERFVRALRSSVRGLVVDAAFEQCGACRSVAYDLQRGTGAPVHALGLTDHTKCLCDPLMNKYPDTARIVEVAEQVVSRAERL